ncbi:MAG TPA: GDP-mannose 4,6-dehydratase [Gemmataceae bacterium]|nr:GDP-mannose 4,6-dehydratase [Gemmataceae bacterium]
MRILLTGVSGFAGGHLAEALLEQGGVELYGTGQRGQWPSELWHLADRVVLRRCPLDDGATIEALLREIQPEQIYHLAGYSDAGRSFREAEDAWAGNLTGTRCLYDAILRWGGRPRILYVGSGIVYGDLEDPTRAHDELSPLRPASPYAASKAAADLLSYQYARCAGLDIVRVRPFNHIGPRQSPQYAVAHFAQQLAAIDCGKQAPLLETGNLDPRRDLTDVRDMVRAYMLLMERGRSGEVYNVGTGQAHSMREVLNRLLALTRVPIEVRQRPGLVRATDTNVILADPSKLRSEVGWQPQRSLDQTLVDTLDYWRQTFTARKTA